MKIKKEELRKALEIVKPGLANKEIIEQSTSFAFMDGRVVTYNDEISISHPVEGLEIMGAIPAQELYQLLGKTKKEDLEVQITDSEIRISSGREKAGFTLTQEIRLPLESMKIPDKWKKIPANLLEAIKFCAFCCSRDMSRPVLTCVHVRKDGAIEASDGFRLTQYQMEKLPIKTFLLPATSSQHLQSLDVNEIAEGDGWVHFRTASGTIFSCRILADNYPDTSMLLEVTGQKIKLPKNLGDILDRASIFAKGEFFLDTKAEITLGKNRMSVRTAGTTSWFEAETNVRYDGDSLSFTINPQFLKEVCEKELSCIVGENRILFEGENWKHVIALFSSGDAA